MSEKAIYIENLPQLRQPYLIAGFDGWGNALHISRAMASFLIRQLDAKRFAKLNPDPFYRYEESRPIVHIEAGMLRKVSPPGGAFYAATSDSYNRDLVILQAGEPHLRWIYFVKELLDLCERLGIDTIITLGGMYDNVLHSDKIVSGIASDRDLMIELNERGVIPINYQGPGAIHSTIHQEGKTKGFRCISLWCHCPYYLQGATHFGLLSHLGSLLASLGGFTLDTTELDKSWGELHRQIQILVEKNPELQAMIEKLRKEKVRGSWANVKSTVRKDDKIIYLSDFLKP